MNATELILNPDGSIYHLGLQAEQVAPIVITVGDPDRVPHVSRYFDALECTVQKREFVTHTGRLGRHRISVVSTGIGTDNVDIVLNELDALVNIDLQSRTIKNKHKSLTIIRIGTAGCLQAAVGVDAFVASSGAFGMDGLLHYYQAAHLQQNAHVQALRAHCVGQWDFPLSPYFVRGNAGLLAAFSGEFVQGITATNPGFYGPQGRRLRVPVAQPGYLDLLQIFDYQGDKIVNLEMETAAIYGLSDLMGHRAVSLSAILANRALGVFSPNPEKTVQRLIEVALEKLDTLIPLQP